MKLEQHVKETQINKIERTTSYPGKTDTKTQKLPNLSRPELFITKLDSDLFFQER